MQNELECLGDREGHKGHLAEKFLKKYYYSCSLNDSEKILLRNLF